MLCGLQEHTGGHEERGPDADYRQLKEGKHMD